MTSTRRCVHVWASADTAPQDVLGRYGLTFAHDARGRPIAAGAPGVGVSVSHGGGALLVAIAAGCRVGVDVEPVADRGLARLPAHALAPTELDELERPGVDRLSTFLSYWTRKEALLKAARVGLAVDPRAVVLGPPAGSGRPLALPEALGSPGGWTIAELPLAGLAVAVAANAPAIGVSLFGALWGQGSIPQARASSAACAWAL